ncbi:spore coat protein, CotS family [Marininema mesophilum]|uniref:Spore coat protein, CotS family n=2 Tax=Marininema mesophilum TaxID=1048340 RepID=A0A1H2S9N7_9BACL|nr:spore coat protein, CotS family [Marininema mesophilum]
MPLIRTDGRQWLLSSWVEGKRTTYKNRKEITIVASMLGKFHALGRGLAVTDSGIHRQHLLHRVHSRFQSFSSLLHSLGKWQEDEYDLHHVASIFHTYGQEALGRLNQLPLAELCEWDRRTHSITHRDLASHNILLNKEDTPWLIDFETAAYDCQVGDIWQLLSRGLSEQQWNRSVAEEVLAAYEAHRPLTVLEKRILVTLLSFPNEFYREALGLILQKDGYGKNKTLPYLEQLARDIPCWRSFLKEIEVAW